jgi:DNA-binding transcriptional regulator YdaS (Cro superfamily)
MKTPKTPSPIDAAGPRSVTADRLGVNRSTLTRWAENGVPAERVVEVERVTGIPREQLRPDLFQKEQDHAVSNA